MRPRILIGRSYEPLIACRYPFLLVEGPRGTSKTRTILSVLLARMLKWPGTRTLLCREYRAELTKTVLTTLEDEVFPAFGMPVPGGAHRENRSEYVLPNRSTFFLAGLHEGSGALSMGMTFAYCAEVLQMEEKKVLDIAGCLRWMQSPERPTLPDFTQLVCDENPGAPQHWANQKAEPIDNPLRVVRTREDYDRLQAYNAAPATDPVNRWKRIVTKIQDNPGYWDHDAWDYTPLGRKYVTETLGVYKGSRKVQWVDGIHVADEGAVFPEFTEERNTCDPFPGGWPADWPMWVLYDSGYGHPTGLCCFGLAPNGQRYVFDDLLKPGMNLDDVAEWIKPRIETRNVRGMLADPRRVFSKTDLGEGKTIADRLWERHGLRFHPYPRKAGKEVQHQVEGLRLWLVDEKQPLKVWNTCRGTIANFQSWAFKKAADGSLTVGDDAYEDANNDIIDPLLGICSMNVTYAAGSIRRAGPRGE